MAGDGQTNGDVRIALRTIHASGGSGRPAGELRYHRAGRRSGARRLESPVRARPAMHGPQGLGAALRRCLPGESEVCGEGSVWILL